MDLKDLKSAWNDYSSREASRRELDEPTIREMLKTRTINIVDKVERNIKINFAILFLILLFLVFGRFFITVSIPEGFEKPVWLILLDWLNIFFLAGTFIYFIIRYYSIRKRYAEISGLRASLKRIIKTLNTYQILFNLALFVLLVVAIVEFISGMYDGAVISALRHGGSSADLNTHQLFWAIIRGVGVLFFIVAIVFFSFRWGFKRLYGKYLVKLKATLHELDEIE